MSYILNALRKSEQERQQHQEPNLTAQLQDSKSGKSANHTRWFILLLALNATLLGYVLIRDDSDETRNTVPVTQKAVLATKVNTVAPTGKASVPDKIPAAVLQSMPEAESIATMVKTHKPPAVKAAPVKTEHNVAVELPPKTAQNVETGSNPAIEHDQVITGKVKKGSEQDDTDIPWLSELPATFRRNVPELDINVYVYSEQAENRFIMVSMHKYLAGQEITAGMKLKEIEPDGIVVEYDDRQFKIRRD